VIPGRTRLGDITRNLVDTAKGRCKADLVVKNASLINVHTREILEGQDVAVKMDRIAMVGDASHTIGPETITIDAKGRYLAPGFIDSHVHIESTMITPSQFARAVLPHGTTTAFVDPHEMANVLGLRGVKLFLDESRELPLKVLITVPSCVPAAPGFETAGAELDSGDIQEALTWNGVVALGEMMNYPGVLASDPGVHAKIAAALNAGAVVEGHAVDLVGNDLAAYCAGAITSCHESRKKIHAVQKLRLGMYAMLREGSAWRDVAETIKCITEEKIDPRHVTLVTDDREPHSVLTEGHVDHVARRAIEEGVDPLVAIQMATINPAEHYECARELGNIAPARYADMLILDHLESVKVNEVIADGKLVAKSGKMLRDVRTSSYPDYAKKSVHLKAMPGPTDLRIVTTRTNGTVRVTAIEVIPGSAYTKKGEVEAPVKNHEVLPNPEEDLMKIAVFERHHGTGNIGLGFIKGLGVKEGAVASTVAHDSHNLVVAGTNDHDMVVAVNTLVSVGGGMVVVKDGEPLGLVKLPIAGLMSDRPVEEVASAVEALKEAWNKVGSKIPSPYMTLSLTTLSVIPEMRITDKGLFDAVKFEFVKPVIE